VEDRPPFGARRLWLLANYGGTAAIALGLVAGLLYVLGPRWAYSVSLVALYLVAAPALLATAILVRRYHRETGRWWPRPGPN
jgi:hypothetical protein